MDQSTLHLVISIVTMVAVSVGAIATVLQYRNRYGTPAIVVESFGAPHGIPRDCYSLLVEGRSEWRITRIRLTRRSARSVDLFDFGSGSEDQSVPEVRPYSQTKTPIPIPVCVSPKKGKNTSKARLSIEARPYRLAGPVKVHRESVALTKNP